MKIFNILFNKKHPSNNNHFLRIETNEKWDKVPDTLKFQYGNEDVILTQTMNGEEARYMNGKSPQPEFKEPVFIYEWQQK